MADSFAQSLESSFFTPLSSNTEANDNSNRLPRIIITTKNPDQIFSRGTPQTLTAPTKKAAQAIIVVRNAVTSLSFGRLLVTVCLWEYFFGE